MLRLTISDDGKGIDPSTPKGFGLTTMTKRVKLLCTIFDRSLGMIARHD
jgi:signal transduction histidine kinase